jgi:hypothetical protein
MKMTIKALESGTISRTLAASDLRRLDARWNAEALRHERAADDLHEFGGDDDEERMLHIEIARTLRNCARELYTAKAA